MDPSLLLSLEQEFRIKHFSEQVRSLSNEELEELIIELYQNSLVQERLLKRMMDEYMGLSAAATHAER